MTTAVDRHRRINLNRVAQGLSGGHREIIDLTRHNVSDEVSARAAAAFSERELGQVIPMAPTLNARNRIGVTTRLPSPKHSYG